VDNTFCIAEPTVDNLRMLKTVLRGFVMALGLKVNFWKSLLMGINIDRDFMQMTCNLLSCNDGTIPFMYLGLPV